MYAEYGAPLIGAGWYVGQLVWLRLPTGPMLVWLGDFWQGLAEIVPLEYDGIPMRVPVERLAATRAEAVAA